MSLPKISIEELAPGTVPHCEYFPPAVDGETSDFELDCLCRLVMAKGPRRLFEFGTFRGRTARNLHAHAPVGAELLTVDLPVPYSPAYPLWCAEGQYRLENPGELLIDIELARVWKVDTVYLPLSGPPRYEFIFVDGSHSYEYCLNDSLKALAMRAPGGVIVWHDYVDCWPGVKESLEFLAAKSEPFAGLRHIEGSNLAVLWS